MVRDIWIISTNGGGTVEDLREGKNASIIPISDNVKYLEKAIKEMFKIDWKDYTNSYKKDITSYEKQAKHLVRIFDSLLEKNIE